MLPRGPFLFDQRCDVAGKLDLRVAALGPEPEQTSCTKRLVEMAKTQRTTPAKSERIGGHCGI